MSNSNITLTQTTKEDLEILFGFQLDEEARYLAAFMGKDSQDKTAYIERHTTYLTDADKTTRTIKLNGVIAGSIAKFVMGDEAEITYWIDKQFWGKGIATAALEAFLNIEKTRPIYGRVAFDNYGSQKVLEKCGFERVGTDKGFASARQQEIEEYVYKLSE